MNIYGWNNTEVLNWRVVTQNMSADFIYFYILYFFKTSEITMINTLM